MTASQAMFSITTMSKTLGVSRSGFYAWRERAASARSTMRAAISVEWDGGGFAPPDVEIAHQPMLPRSI